MRICGNTASEDTYLMYGGSRFTFGKNIWHLENGTFEKVGIIVHLRRKLTENENIGGFRKALDRVGII
jgi:hypothetical protein